MTKLKSPIKFETTFAEYSVDELIGEGGAGRVYGGVSADGERIAIKVLAQDKASTEKRRRFKNEISFLARNKHENVVGVIDHGLISDAKVAGPFYVMRRYDGSLRDLITRGVAKGSLLPLFSQILNGTEAAHLQNVVHRDLKPENILHGTSGTSLAIADFGIARFTEELLATAVQTRAADRLGNFQYAAPEQRHRGAPVGIPADIYALGLILNEMATGVVPLGTAYKTIADVASDLNFLDDIVAKMIRNNPTERPQSIREVKTLIERHRSEHIVQQRLSQIDNSVVKVGEVDDPLAFEAPRLVDANWNRGTLTLTLDRPVSQQWVEALHNMGNYSAPMGYPPQAFQFSGNKTSIHAEEIYVQSIIDHLKNWLPVATMLHKARLEQQAQQAQIRRQEELRREREIEEQQLRVNRNIKI